MSVYAVIDPATGETVKEYPTISDDELRDAIALADETFHTWSSSTTVKERAELIRRVGQLHAERREQLGEIIVREMGKPIEQAMGEVDFSAAIYEFYADNGESLMADDPISLLDGDGSAYVRRSPYGVLLGIMPWNYPYYQVARFAGPNLVIGNTILLKHAPQCPESAAAMADIFHEAGFPEGAYINIYATNEQIEWVIGDPRVRGVSLTGSERAGAAVAAIAGRNLKKVVLELGGSDPFILLRTHDLDKAVEAAVAARLENTGQACNAGKRFIVVDELYEPFLEKFTAALTAVKPGDPNSSETTIGPLSSKTAADRLEDQVNRAVEHGANLVAGGKREGQLLRAHGSDRDHARQRRLPRGVLRAGGAGVSGRGRRRGGQARQRHTVRPRLIRDERRPRSGSASRRQTRGRHGVHQCGWRRGRRVALRGHQALRLRSRARPLRHGRVREQEAHPHRRLAGVTADPIMARPANRARRRSARSAGR